MQHVRQCRKPELDFKDLAFTDFQSALNTKMKWLKQTGMGSHDKQAEPLTETKEEMLWKKSFRADHSPWALINAVFYLNSICFTLSSGKEHCQLWVVPLILNNCQIRVIQKPGEKAFLLHMEDASKNNTSAHKLRKVKPKQVFYYENTDNPARCLVQLYRYSMSTCLQQSINNAFYLKLLQELKDDIQFSCVLIGHNTLDKMVMSMCNFTGIAGYKTSHSLHATVAIGCFHAGMNKQLIMERTGHRKLNSRAKWIHFRHSWRIQAGMQKAYTLSTLTRKTVPARFGSAQHATKY